jgi:uncharacterized SAM-binding protein YcdF (DUF218 family)
MISTRRNGWLILLLAVGLLSAILLIGAGGFGVAGDFLVHADELKRSGAVVLLSGGGTERMDEAALLMRDRYAELLILTNTDRTMADGLLEWQYMRQEMISRSVSPAQIEVTDHAVGSTRDEAHAVREYMQRHSVSSCIVVTDPFHTRRTRLIFRKELEGSGIEVSVIPARSHWYRANTWFLSWRGWQATVSEYIKLGAFFLGG